MDKDLLDVLEKAGVGRVGIRKSLVCYGITSIASFIEKGEKALTHMADDRRSAYAVMEEGDPRDGNIATIGEWVQLKEVLAELKSGANGGLHALLYRLESVVCNMSARVL